MQRYDFGFSQHLEGESHGGTTFCALAALQLSGQLHRFDEQTLEGIKRWLLFRQVNYMLFYFILKHTNKLFLFYLQKKKGRWLSRAPKQTSRHMLFFLDWFCP